MHGKIQAVVFDLDDTLTPENAYQESANKAVLSYLHAKTGIHRPTIDTLAAEAATGPRQEYFQSVLTKLGIDPTDDLIASMLDVHRTHIPTISWYPDVVETIDKLANRDMRLGIITDGYSSAQWSKLESLGATDLFDAIVVTDDLGREFWKPHPSPFLAAAEKLDVEVSQMMYVGDNPSKDFLVSKVLPVLTVRVLREGQIKADLPYRDGVREKYRVKTLIEIPSLVSRLNAEESNE